MPMHSFFFLHLRVRATLITCSFLCVCACLCSSPRAVVSLLLKAFLPRPPHFLFFSNFAFFHPLPVACVLFLAALLCFFSPLLSPTTVAFQVYDIDGDGFISNSELFRVLKMMVGNNLNDVQLQQIVDKTVIEADKDKDGLISFEEFVNVCSECARGERERT